MEDNKIIWYLENISGQIGDMSERIDYLDKKIDKVEATLNEKIDMVEKVLDIEINEVYKIACENKSNIETLLIPFNDILGADYFNIQVCFCMHSPDEYSKQKVYFNKHCALGCIRLAQTKFTISRSHQKILLEPSIYLFKFSISKKSLSFMCSTALVE